ncbi:MAG: hypothetical protein EX269_04785 [Acidimicrobiales bacterium]|nr:MAG: hypothetical protein EX269_04785 [Acidimicrobiales bacterium]
MACSHADSCPLHPHLNDSLAGWRDFFCDSTAEWKQCARYEKSLTGQPVPLALLPNGKMIGGTAGITGGKPRTGEAVKSAAETSQPATEPAHTATTTRVLEDARTETLLDEARKTKPSRWSRFTNLFGGFR